MKSSMVGKNLSFSLKKVFLALFSVVFSLLPLESTFAAAHSLSLSCPTSVAATQSVSCTITGYSSDSISSISSQFSVNNLEISSFTATSPWSGSISGNQLTISAQSGQSGNLTIGTISFVASNFSGANASVSLGNAFFGNGNYTRFSVGDASASISITAAPVSPSGDTVVPSDDQEPSEDEESEDSESVGADATALKSLKIAGYTLDFTQNQYTYTLQTKGESSLAITAVPFDETATVTISNNNDLKDGSIIKITVENTTSKSIYRIKIVTSAPASESTAEKTPESTSPDTTTIIILVCIAILIIITIVLAFFLLRKKKPKKSPLSAPVSTSSVRQPKNPFISHTNPQLPPVKPEGSAYGFSEKPVENSVESTPKPLSQPASPTPSTPPETAQPTPPSPNPFLAAPPKPTIPPNPFLTPAPTQPQTTATPTTSAPPVPPGSNRPISLDDIPFNQPSASPDTQKPTTPIIFES